jgi:1-deoxy-D-xylulose-5-phosphate synthase
MPGLLDEINSPADLKRLNERQLKQLAGEIRQELVSVVSANGGHLASNLGVVELTIALHRVFESPRDKIIWDVGHQGYVHKILTDRRQCLGTLRQYQGISGFTSREESQHDPFGAGHASTSVSAALGMARARDQTGDSYHVLAVIGDGAITGGMAMEALNHAGHLGTRLIVVLNDNGMSISPTVGAIARMLDRIRFDHRYHAATEKGWRLFSSMPFGKKLWQAGKIFQDQLTSFIKHSGFWEEMGFAYLGPVDGHNTGELIAAFIKARDYQRRKPVFVHVITTKGKGYHPAETDAVYFHGVSPARPGNRPNIPTYSEVFAYTTLRLARDNPKLVVITPAMPEGNSLNIVRNEFPDRVYDVGICEQHAVTFAAGMAAQGLIPVVAIYSTFLQRSFDQIIHDVCLQELPIIFAIDRAGIVGDDGKTHQGIFDLSYLSLIPNLVVAAPRDENELQHLFYTAVNLRRPMAIRYPRSAGVGVALDSIFKEFPVGKGELLRRGSDLAIIAIGNRVLPAMEAAEMLSASGINTAVVNARFAQPLDSELISEVAREVKNLITVEENVASGGFGSRVASLIFSRGIPGVKLKSLAVPDEFVEHGSQEVLRAKYDLDAEGIVRQALAMVASQSCPLPARRDLEKD